MDLSEFERNFNKVQSDLSKWLSTNETHVNFLLYESFQFYFIDITNIIDRIENEAQVIGIIIKSPPEVKEEDYFDSLRNHVKNWELFRLDIKSFFVFTKIFLDTLARIIICVYGEKGVQLPPNMTDLLKKKALNLENELDAEFFANLRNKMIWYKDFNEKRDDIVHWLGSVRKATMNGKTSFDILKFDIHAKEQKKEQREEWGSKTVIPLEYLKETIDNLSEVILCIHGKSKNFKGN
jgi:hypothetical protein